MPQTTVHSSKVILALSVSLVLISQTTQAKKTQCIAIAATNDLHGAIEPHSYTQFGKEVRVGGLLIQSGYITQLRKQFADRLLLLDGGDLFQGTLASNTSKGAAIIDAYNTLGYTAAAVGNHEFDFGPLSPTNADRIGVLKQRLAQANFPFLAANIIENSSKKLVTWDNLHPSILIEKAGISIGIIGISTPETPYTTRPSNIKTLQFTAPADAISTQSRLLRAAGAQLVIALTHMGSHCHSTQDPNDLSSCKHHGELFSVLKKLPFGTVDVAIGGHTHGFIAHWVNGTATIESGSRGRHIGLIKACFNEQNLFDRKLTTISQPIELCWETWSDGSCKPQQSPSPLSPAYFLGAKITPTNAIKKVLQPYLEQVTALRQKRLNAFLPQPATRGDHEDSIGLLVARAARNSVKADIGLQNRGGVRANLPSGEIRYGMAYEVLPFGNHVAVLTLTGKQLSELISVLVGKQKRFPYLAGLRAAHVDGTLKFTLTNGAPLDPRKSYRVATNDYIADGGEKLDPVLKKLPAESIQKQSLSLLEAFIDYLETTFPRYIAHNQSE